MFLLSSIIKRAKKCKEKRIEIEKKRKENIRKQKDELYEIIMKALKRYD